MQNDPWYFLGLALFLFLCFIFLGLVLSFPKLWVRVPRRKEIERMSKKKESRSFEEWMSQVVTSEEVSQKFLHLSRLSRLSRFNISDLEAWQREAYEAGRASAEAVVEGIPACNLQIGDLFRKVHGKQVYILISSVHLVSFDAHPPLFAVNAKGNPIRLSDEARVVRCKERDFFAAKKL